MSQALNTESHPQAASVTLPPHDHERVLAIPVPFLYLYAIFAPLWERCRRGEGALLAINGAVVWASWSTAWEGIIRIVLSLVVLALLYAFNDFHDARGDLKNPKKNRRLTVLYLDRRRELGWVLLAGHLAAIGASFFFLGPATALSVLGVSCANILYSTKVKGVPFLDVALVGIWGALYTSISAASWPLCAMVGIMTAIMHIFQVLVDRDVDAGNDICTSAVYSRLCTTALQFLSAALLFLVAFYQVPLAWAFLALVPLLAHGFIRRTEWAWMASRLAFGVLLLAALGVIGGAS